MSDGMKARKLAALLLGAALAGVCSCDNSPVESEGLSSDTYSERTSLRLSAFGVLTPSESTQRIMFEDSRNNVMEHFTNQNYMSVSGSVADANRIYDLALSGLLIADPFQMPQVFETQVDIGVAIQEARAEAALTEDYSLVEYLQQLQAATAVGLIRYVSWLSSSLLNVAEGRDYWIELVAVDRDYPDIQITIRQATTVPGGFEITYPPDGGTAASAEALQLRWTASDKAAGYRIIGTTPLSPYKRFDTVVRGNSYAIPQFFQERAPYKVQIWALDQHYFSFLTQRLEQQRVDRTYFFDYGPINVSALAILGARVIRTVEFNVE